MNLSNKLKSKMVKILRNFLFVFGVFVVILILAGIFWVIWELYIVDNISGGRNNKRMNEAGFLDEGSSFGKECNVLGISLQGSLYTYIPAYQYDNGNYLIDASSSEDIQYLIREAMESRNIKAVFLEIDSYGGEAVAGEEIANALKLLDKPSVALIRTAGVSAAYLAATGADTIFASKNSDVGSIGVTMSYLDNSKQNQREGLTYNQLSTGKFKDTGDPDKPLTFEERQYLERDLKIMLENFIQDVSANRNLSVDKVRALADGSTMLGEMALKNGLIDKIGDLNSVEQYLKEKLNEEIVVCW